MRVRDSGSKFTAEDAPGIRPHVVGEEHGNHLIVRLLCCGIRKRTLRGSPILEGRFKRQNLAIVAYQRDRGIGHLLAESQVLGLSHQVSDGIHIDHTRMLQTERRLCFEDLEHGAVEPFAGNLTRLHGLEQGVVRGGKVGGDEQQVAAGLESLYGGPSYVVREQVRQASHVERVGDDDAFEAQLFFQQVGDDDRRNRGYVVRDQDRARGQ